MHFKTLFFQKVIQSLPATDLPLPPRSARTAAKHRLFAYFIYKWFLILLFCPFHVVDLQDLGLCLKASPAWRINQCDPMWDRIPDILPLKQRKVVGEHIGNLVRATNQGIQTMTRTFAFPSHQQRGLGYPFQPRRASSSRYLLVGFTSLALHSCIHFEHCLTDWGTGFVPLPDKQTLSSPIPSQQLVRIHYNFVAQNCLCVTCSSQCMCIACPEQRNKQKKKNVNSSVLAASNSWKTRQSAKPWPALALRASCSRRPAGHP